MGELLGKNAYEHFWQLQSLPIKNDNLKPILCPDQKYNKIVNINQALSPSPCPAPSACPVSSSSKMRFSNSQHSATKFCKSSSTLVGSEKLKPRRICSSALMISSLLSLAPLHSMMQLVEAFTVSFILPAMKNTAPANFMHFSTVPQNSSSMRICRAREQEETLKPEAQNKCCSILNAYFLHFMGVHLPQGATSYVYLLGERVLCSSFSFSLTSLLTVLLILLLIFFLFSLATVVSVQRMSFMFIQVSIIITLVNMQIKTVSSRIHHQFIIQKLIYHHAPPYFSFRQSITFNTIGSSYAILPFNQYIACTTCQQVEPGRSRITQRAARSISLQLVGLTQVMMLEQQRLKRPMMIVEKLLRRTLTRVWWESLQFKGYQGKSMEKTGSVPFQILNLRGWEMVILFSLASCRPKPQMMSLLTLFLYFSQYAEFSPLISRLPNISFQSRSTVFSQPTYYCSLPCRIFKLHQLSLEGWYLLLKGVRLKVGERSVVSVRMETAQQKSV